ncbi:MAG TPA: hypothetical protein VIX18_04160, partial [Nitrospirota bacterium]
MAQVTRDELLHALQNNNLQAFLHVIREGESSNDESAYTILNGGEHFIAPPWEHPSRVGKGGTSTAAGAYQFVIKTWRNVAAQYGLPDFSPINQDCGAVALIVQHGAMDLVLSGRPLEAIRRINSKWIEWECFERKQFLAQVPAIFAAYGGVEGSTGGSVPSPANPPVTQADREVIMAPLVLPLLEIAASLIPQLGKLFGSGTEVSNRNVAAASIVADSLVKATSAVNLQDAVERIQRDPDARQAAAQAVSDVLFSIGESGGGGIDGARKLATSPEQQPLLKQGAFWISLLLTVMPFMLLADVFYVHPDNYDGNLRTQIVTGVMLIISMRGGGGDPARAAPRVAKEALAAQVDVDGKAGREDHIRGRRRGSEQE